MKFLDKMTLALVILSLTTAGPAMAQFVTGPVTWTISGNTGVGGVVIKGLAGDPVSDENGYYSVEVPYAWSGTVTPTKEGYFFEPPSLTYSNVEADQTNQNYSAKSRSSDAPNSDPYGSVERSRSRSSRRGSAPGMDMMYGSRAASSSGYKPTIRSAGRKALVIPAGEVKTEELAETVEDMRVMSHILDERFKETRRIQGMFTDFGAFFGQDSRNTEATYLQGFGLLFLMEVNFAFSPAPRPQAKDPTETAEAGDSTWQKAKQQVLSPGASPGMDREDSARDHDNQMVEELKKELIEALKHASNIRNIDPDEWVILTVIGSQRQFGMGFGGPLPMGGGMSGFRSSSRSGGSSGVMMGGMGGYGGAAGGFGGGNAGGFGGASYGGMMMGGGMVGGMGGFSTTASSPSTVLTIRAKKTNVDDFAKGELDFEQFLKEVKILMY